MKGVQCYELFGGIALKNHTFSFFQYATVGSACDATVSQEDRLVVSVESFASGHTTLY